MTSQPLTRAAPRTISRNATSTRRMIGRPMRPPTTRTVTAASTVTIPGFRVTHVMGSAALPVVAPQLVRLEPLLPREADARLTVGELVRVHPVDGRLGHD